MAKNNRNRKQTSDTEFAQEVTARNAKQPAAQNNAATNACGFANENQNV